MFYKIFRSHGAIILTIILFGAINQLFLRYNLPGSFGIFLDYYFNDVLASILILTWTDALLSLRDQRLDNYVHIFLLTLAIALFWEYITPLYHTGSTTDLWDVVAYLIGGIIFSLFVLYRKQKP
ncbi:MAG: hypothetical protein Q8S15_03240 [Erysipelotrichaceae bacterium]|nr:hypothetical protein [Erysipelotrichaceae bacterium]MDP3305067.1 hypothetical protein [Erysipelotrichaceae bacterium]